MNQHATESVHLHRRYTAACDSLHHHLFHAILWQPTSYLADGHHILLRYISILFIFFAV